MKKCSFLVLLNGGLCFLLSLEFFRAEKYERDAKKYWDIFYKRHQDRVFFSPLLSLNFIVLYIYLFLFNPLKLLSLICFCVE